MEGKEEGGEASSREEKQMDKREKEVGAEETRKSCLSPIVNLLSSDKEYFDWI